MKAPGVGLSPVRRAPVLPGFRLTLGITLGWTGLLIILPFSALGAYSTSLGWGGLWEAVTTPMALSAFQKTLSAAFIAASANLVFGFVTAWVLVRYRFPGKALLDLLVDLPLALPSVVGGIALVTVFGGQGFMGSWLEPLGIKVAYTELGVWVGTTFIGLPLVIRSLQPVIENLDPTWEEAAACLGSSRWTTFRRVLLPPLVPAALSGFTLAFSKGLGEYGTVIFLSSNIPFQTETATRFVYNKLDQYQIPEAAGVSLVLILASFVLLLLLGALNGLNKRKVEP